MADSSVTQPLKCDQKIFSFDVNDDGEADVTAFVSQSSGLRQISIYTYLDKHGRQLFFSVMEPRVTGVKSIIFVRTKNGKWISDESERNYAVWVQGLKSFVDSVGGAEKYLNLQMEFLQKLLECYKDQLELNR